MALGTDLWWAGAVVANKIRLWAHIPSKQWRQAGRDEWERLPRVAWKLTTYGGIYDVKLLHARNDGMLRESAAVVAVLLTGKTDGGTASAVRKATALGLPDIRR